MSTSLPRAVGATPPQGKSTKGFDELREFRKYTPAEDSEYYSFDANRKSPVLKGNDDQAKSGNAKGKIPRAISTPVSPAADVTNVSTAFPAAERRQDRRFWPKDTRALLELCEQGYALQQGMKDRCAETADTLETLAENCDSMMKGMLTKMEGTLNWIHVEVEKNANIDWAPIIRELHEKVGPEMVHELLSRQEIAAQKAEEQMAQKLSAFVVQVADTLTSRDQENKKELASIRQEIEVVQTRAAESEKLSQQSQEDMKTVLSEQQASLQTYVKQVVGEELHQVSLGVEESRKRVADMEPLLASHFNQLTTSQETDGDLIKNIHNTLSVDLGQLFQEIGAIQRCLNLDHIASDPRGNAARDGLRKREYWTQTDAQVVGEAYCQTDLNITMPADPVKKKKDKKAVMPKAVAAMQQKAPGNALLENDQVRKKKMRQQLMKHHYNVADWYKDKGYAQAIAKSSYFENLTFLVIFLNALWIAVDTDNNSASVLIDAHVVFQVAENLFCSYFTGELLIRFLAFRRKRYCLRDFWFVFDGVLVAGMIAETWVLSAVMLGMNVGTAGAGGVGNLSILRMARLIKIFRMARMARLLRAVPELIMILKGIGQALRSAMFFLVLCVAIIYIFAVCFRQLTKDTQVGDQYFSTVPKAMNVLLLQGMLPVYEPIITNSSKDNVLLWALMLTFVLLASITILNMLIGVVCEVVRQVAQTEKETMTVTHVTQQLKEVMSEFQAGSLAEDDSHRIMGSLTSMRKRSFRNLPSVDVSQLGTLSKNDFESFLDKPKVAKIMHDVGVDASALVDMSDVIYEDKDKDGTGLTFEDFLDVILNLRGSNPATVKDVKETQRILKTVVQESRFFMKRILVKEIGDFRVEMVQQLIALLNELHRDSDSDEEADKTTSGNVPSFSGLAAIAARGREGSGEANSECCDDEVREMDSIIEQDSNAS